MSKKILILVAVIALFLSGCSKIKLDDNGLTPDINSFLPDSVYQSMKTLGMVINTGNRPPTLNKEYLVSPFILKSSNISYDSPGSTFSDLYVKFYDFDRNTLTCKVDYKNGPEKGTGLGSYIVGKSKDFSVFAEIKSFVSETDSATLTMVFSGTLQTLGIKDFYYANFMINNYGNSSGYWIENGQGRVLYDSDGLSEINNWKKYEIGQLKGISQK